MTASDADSGGAAQQERAKLAADVLFGCADDQMRNIAGLHTMARLTPVLPTVPSVTSPPGIRRPSARASRTICSATLSFTLPPGLRNSAFPSTWWDVWGGCRGLAVNRYSAECNTQGDGEREIRKEGGGGGGGGPRSRLLH